MNKTHLKVASTFNLVLRTSLECKTEVLNLCILGVSVVIKFSKEKKNQNHQKWKCLLFFWIIRCPEWPPSYICPYNSDDSLSPASHRVAVSRITSGTYLCPAAGQGVHSDWLGESPVSQRQQCWPAAVWPPSVSSAPCWSCLSTEWCRRHAALRTWDTGGGRMC